MISSLFGKDGAPAPPTAAMSKEAELAAVPAPNSPARKAKTVETQWSPQSTPARGDNAGDEAQPAATVGVSKFRTKGDKSSARRFADLGEYGFYEGQLSSDGKRHGRGKMTYDSGNTYEGSFADDKYHGDHGVYTWFDGDVHEGPWREGERHGISVFRSANGVVEYSVYDQGKVVGEGITFSPDRKKTHRTHDGRKKELITEEEAAKLAKKFGMSVPEPSTAVPTLPTVAEAPSATKTIGLLGRIFSSRKVGPDGTLFFKDYGDWGTYEGDVDEAGNRQGFGVMTYDSGNYYEGGFVNDKFEGEKGIYRWYDGDEYEGAWKDNERNGVGIFRVSDGTVEYSRYEKGAHKGDGVWWSADRKSAKKLVAGVKKEDVSLAMAETMAKDQFNLPVPEPSTVKPAATKGVGLLGRLFAKKKMGPDGKMLCKDHGEWGTYDGELDAENNRQGKGKMTYNSGNYYEGGFVDDKFHGDKGVYHWADGDEYEGGWKDGERNGVGIFRAADGSVDYSVYEKGAHVGDGVWWSVDRKAAHKMVAGTKKEEMLGEEAESYAKVAFDLPVPEPSISTTAAAATAVSKSVGLLGRFFATKKVGSDGKMLYKDNGEWGSYEGDLDDAGNRHGKGKMTYDSGNSYEGDFFNDKYHGDKGIYHWSDGDEYEGAWKDGERNGVGIFRTADGGCDYSNYVNGGHVGEGVWWSADRKQAHKMVDGKKKSEISSGMAAKLAKDKFDLPVPEPLSSKPAAVTKSVGLLGRLFSGRKVGPDGKLMFKDYGEWGTYDGDVDADGKRQGNGKMTYGSGNYYHGPFVDDKFHGDKGIYHWNDGDEFVGQWSDGERNGIGSFQAADGSVEYSKYEKGTGVGEGVWWSADRKQAKKMVDGKKKMELLIEEAEAFAKEKFDLPIPEVSAVPAPAPTASKLGFFARLFRSSDDGIVGPDGILRFKDYGDWGVYDGELDATGKRREGKGEMKYHSGGWYKGSFKDNKYHGDHGIYHWADDDEYEGSWSKGERNGIGIFRSSDGKTSYSAYENGTDVGEGVAWSADRKTAYKTTAGKNISEISLSLAERTAKDKFNLPVPPPCKPAPKSKPSLLGRAFRKGDPVVKKGPRFEDFGDMGTYHEGELVNGLRQGEGKMSYDSGNTYEGDFSDGKFHGNRGLYRWSDGTEYEGSWKEGVFHGIGIYRTPDAGVDYSMYKDGFATGVGLFWDTSSSKAHYTFDGVKMNEASLSDAEKLASDKFGLPAPSSNAQSSSVGLIGRLFAKKKMGPDGKMCFHDYGEWGTYDGDLDANQDRTGKGKIVYGSGNYYEGGFVNDKYHGDKGVYHWADGDEYEGAWKDGERNGIGIFRAADGSVDYSMYEKGLHVGDGVWWSADRKTAHKMVAGTKKAEMLPEEAESFAKEKFDLPVPEPSAAKPAAKSIGLLGRLFSKRKVGPDGKLMFKDYGDWGTYEGDVDDAGNRQGHGKMTYKSGNYYEGGFVDDKFHGDKGVYHWSDGDEYDGAWKDGERHGKASFKYADGSIDYSMYVSGQAKGEGVKLSADRKSAFSLMDGEKKMEMLLAEAESMVKDKFESS